MKALFIAMLFLASFSSHANKEVELYYKCYAHFVKGIPTIANSTETQIKSGTLTGIQACMNLISMANLQSNNEIKNGTHISGKDEIALNVLNTFHNFHRTWFGAKDYDGALDLGSCVKDTSDIIDSNEMSYHITNSLFKNDVNFKNILLGNSSYDSIRYNSTNNGSRLLHGKLLATAPYKFGIFNSTTTPLTTWDVERVDSGLLIGLRPSTPTMMPSGFYSRTGMDNTVPYDIKKSSGGGLLGTVPYFLLNNGHPRGVKSNGGQKMHRRWSKAVLKDLLCRDLPVLRPEDSFSFVDTESQLPFRIASSCMRCHVSIDQMAGVTRAQSYTWASNSCSNTFTNIAYMPRFPQTAAMDLKIIKSVNDPQYHLKPAIGKFYFRTYSGDLIKQDILSIEHFGNYLGTLDDLYICTAKKYFYFLTGIDVPIYDYTAPDAPKMNKLELLYRDYVVEIGKKLKEDQDLKKLIERIISSKAYMNPGISTIK